jgi:dihydrofolate synthase/folylpolyglutamate synthase
MTYPELLARLIPARRFGVVFGLERMRELLDRLDTGLGPPDRRLGKIVHVGGTNGKGSTAAMIAALARAAGQRVAVYTSPHLSSLRERIAIDGELISEPAIVAAAEQVRGAGGDELTFFEQITAIAMVAIADAAVDVTVVEVGLGGRLDATNVVDPVACVVTGVAMDHEAILGATLPAIAGEKAGIWKRGRPAIIGASGLAEAVPVLIAAAEAAGAPVTVIDDAAIAAVPVVALPGAHQRRNAAAAIAAVRALGLPIVPAALARVRHPGRFEIIDQPGAPRVILDGAHNPHGAAALAAALAERGERPVLIVATSADKDVAGIARALAPAVRAVIATRYQQERSLDPAALAQVFADVAPELPAPTFAPDLAAALAAARAHTAPIAIAGSLFLVGEARTLLLDAPTDPVFVTDPPARPASAASTG